MTPMRMWWGGDGEPERSGREGSIRAVVRPLPLLLALLGALACVAAVAPVPAQAGAAPGPGVVRTLHLDGEVNSVSADYLSSALDRARGDGTASVVLIVNTPGGVSTAMDQMVTALLNSPVPAAVYVSPSGARSASAGLFVAQAADVVAMAPGTNIGSAHPITGSGGDIGGDLGKKILNDAVARIRSLATIHHRNADWCEQAVRNSVNIDADEAVRLHVADLESPTLGNLVSALDGREAPRPDGKTLTFHTAGLPIADEPLNPFQGLLQLLIDPNVAYVLMLIAIFGLIAEVSSPGAILPGVVGGLAAILALVGLSSLPINIAGAALLGFSFLLFVVDIKAQTHGILTVGGLISLLLGSAFLLNNGPVDIGIDPRLILVAAVAVAAGFAFIIRKAVRARSEWAGGTRSALVGSIGEARGPISPTGQVFVAGALWNASSASGPIASGESVRVTAQERMNLQVEPVHRETRNQAADPDDTAGSTGL